MSDRIRATRTLYAYFRGAEYPLSVLRALRAAWRMSAWWPRGGGA